MPDLRKPLGRAWKGWGHGNDLKSLLEMLGWWPYIVGLGGFLVTMFGTPLDLSWSPATVVVASTVVGLLCAIAVSVITIAIKLHRSGRAEATQSDASDPEQIRAQAELTKQQRLREKQNDPIRKIDGKQRELAGTINAMMERAMRWDFRLPLKSGDNFAGQFEELRDSTHVAWTDPDINQLRRDFLNRCGRAGQEYDEVAEAREARDELKEIGTSLVHRLLGQDTPAGERDMTMTDAFHALNDAHEYPAFEDSLYQALYDEKAKAWGRKPLGRFAEYGLGPYHVVPRDYWLKGRLEWTTTGLGGTERATCEGQSDYIGMQFNTSQIRRLAKEIAGQRTR